MNENSTNQPIGACARGEHARCLDADETCPCACHRRERATLARRSFSASGSGTPPLPADQPTPRERIDTARQRLRAALDPQTDAERSCVAWLCGWDLDAVEPLAAMVSRARGETWDTTMAVQGGPEVSLTLLLRRADHPSPRHGVAIDTLDGLPVLTVPDVGKCEGARVGHLVLGLLASAVQDATTEGTSPSAVTEAGREAAAPGRRLAEALRPIADTPTASESEAIAKIRRVRVALNQYDRDMAPEPYGTDESGDESSDA